MAELVAFRASLGCIGFTAAGQDALVAQGFTSMTRLLMFQMDQIKCVCKLLRERERDLIDINMTQEQLLEAMRSWVKTSTHCGMPITPNLFTLEVAEEEAIKIVNALEAVKTDKQDDIKMPSKFKGLDWPINKEAFETYCSHLTSSDGLRTLNYVLRDDEYPEEGVDYVNGHEMMVMRAILTGIQYDRDNERVYLLIKQWILNGPAGSFITPELDRSKDGRAAWLALCARYEGEAYMNRQQEEALATLDKIHYKGKHATLIMTCLLAF